MVKQYNPPVVMQIYLGSGKKGERLRMNLQKLVPPGGSVSAVVVDLLKKAEPSLFKGVEDGKK